MAKTDSTVVVTAALFDLHGNEPIYRVLRHASPVSDWQQIEMSEYKPRGLTPLRDAVAQFITDLAGQRRKGRVVIGCLGDETGSMAGNEEEVVAGINEFVAGMADIEVDPDADGKVFAVILTDGLENQSREVSPAALREMIAQREQEGWVFIYLGANQNAWAVGQGYGLSGGVTGQTVNFASTPEGTRSALRYASSSAREFATANASYLASAGARSQATVSEEGILTTAPQSSSGNVKAAVERAKAATK